MNMGYAGDEGGGAYRVKNSKVWYGMVLYGMVWYGMVLQTVAKHIGLTHSHYIYY